METISENKSAGMTLNVEFISDYGFLPAFDVPGVPVEGVTAGEENSG